MNYMQIARRLEQVLAEFANSISNGMTFDPSDFGDCAAQVAHEVLMMNLVHGHSLTYDDAVTELSQADGALSRSFGTHVLQSVAEVVIDEIGEEVLFIDATQNTSD